MTMSKNLFPSWDGRQWPYTTFLCSLTITSRGTVTSAIVTATTKVDGVETTGCCMAEILTSEDMVETLELLCIEAAIDSLQPALPGLDKPRRPILRPKVH